KLWPYLCNNRHIYELREGNFSNKNIKPARLSADPVSLGFSIQEDERFITIWQQLIKNETVIDAKNVQIHAAGIFIIDDVFHLPSDVDDLDIVKQFKHGFIKIPLTNKLSVITNIIPALQKKYNVHLPPSLKLKSIQVTPKPQVLLKEFNTQYLMLQPQFVYDELTVDYESNPRDILQTLPDQSWLVMLRDTAKEKAFFENLRLLHHLFARQKQNDFFYLPFDDVMKKNWFINTVRQLQENDIPVLGMQDLKKFRYNTNKPKWEMKAGNGIDWFDLSIEVSFGDQVVPLKEVRKALISKQNIVLLGDGTIGVLPEEWLQQYGLMLKIGDEQKDGKIRLSKLHYTLIDELHGQIDDEQVLKEINYKKQRLQNLDNVKTVKVSNQIHATLRPYQQSGFQWMQTLDELGWGGCLADDMGLGKTLQAITFLQYLKEKYAGSTHLVICPTSLVYNWESELKKFAPSLSYHIYYGSSRQFSNEHFEDYDIIITSYGIIRNDLEQLLQFQWHYVILDESQTIKNPDALTTKAVQLLKSKNRLILSGTPVQNNTYDLYSQFNFINPGLLGNREFYKDFANGIDKYNDTEKAAQLRRIVYPFMLRRTKEQVATDLPDKTEMVLWCEMHKEQRVVYDDYKNHYRTTLLKKIEEVGMAKAGMYILEGLLRLRQICDSPQLVKSEDVTTNKSVKIDELMREIKENTGQHKLLVFSQFTEMLQLIKERMEQEVVQYAYLDGSTSAKNRKQAVDDFQNNADIKVFLISLKAGGVGLNLTAADYIYLVDPWWNPAVEQQAIDRTHRIGQKNKIFAYKMICKNTIEEKIIELQQRKKQIANELVTEDAGFIKKLSKDDIAFLFN
ncbi:MAG TPA: SNF2-related protein, partial [Segetibacter sp.]|nr:SNF2-related protein [Segetibacter sp.]